MSEMKPSEAIRACLAWFTSDGDAEYPVEALRAALPQVEAMERDVVATAVVLVTAQNEVEKIRAAKSDQLETLKRDNARLRAELEKAAGQLEGR